MTANINGIDTVALSAFAGTVAANSAEGDLAFLVTSHWRGGTRSEARVTSYRLGKTTHARDFTIHADEPEELLGRNEAPNPQELLFAALNGCMIVGFAANAALANIELKALSIRTEGALDLRGFLGLDPAVNPGYERVRQVIEITTDAPREQVEALFEVVLATSPNFNNFRRAISMAPRLELLPA